MHNRVRKVAFNPACWPEEIQTTTQPAITNIYPNPTTTELTISSANRITTIFITNLLGQTMYSHEYNSQQVQIDVANLPKGIYFIKVNGTEVRKFVKE